MKRLLLIIMSLAFFSMAGVAGELPSLVSSPGPVAAASPLPASASPQDCFLYEIIDFEGTPNHGPVGTIENATFPDPWKGLVDSDAGGNGNFANEPSPETVIFIEDPDGDPTTEDIVIGDILFAEPVGGVSFYYVSITDMVTDELLTLKLYDVDDNLLGTYTMSDTPIFTGGDPTGDFSEWHYTAHHLAGEVIARAEISGAGSYFAIDDFGYLVEGGVVDEDEDAD